MMKKRTLVVLSAVALALVVTACNDPAGPVEVYHQETSTSTVVDDGEQKQLSVPDRDALLLIHTGWLSPQGDRDVELDRVIDADLYVGPRDDIGDPHWITRARVINATGQTLWTQRVNSLFQMLEFLNPVLEQLSPVDLSVEQLYQLARQFYPELLQFAVKVPTEIDGAHAYVLEVNNEEGKWEQVGFYPIPDLKEKAEPPSPEIDYEIETMVETGPPRDRINVAILGDGYTDNQRVTFEADSEAVADRLLETSPFREHADLFNIKRIWTPSNHAGAGFDCNRPNPPPVCTQDFRDTVYETTFVIPALASEFGEELGFDLDGVSDRVALPLQLERVFEVASLAHYDEIIFLSNTRKRSGFAGAYVAVVTAFDNHSRDRFPDVAVHEVGHTMGLLGDEYTNSMDACYYNEPDIPLPVNIDKLNGQSQPQWSEWVDEQTPIPTPESEDHSHKVGAFEGAFNCDFLVRPAKRCMMNRSGDDFCPICAEQMVRRFYSLVDPAPLQNPPEIHADSLEGITLQVPTRETEDTYQNRYEIIWTVDGQVVAEDEPSITLTRDNGLSSRNWLDVEARVQNRSEFLQTPDQATATTHTLELKLAD